MDFGIARILDERHLTSTGTKLGTLYYMSPEQVKASKDIDHRSDIFSSGIVLYEMLTGRLPYDTNTESDFSIMTEIVGKDLPDPRDVYPHISPKAISLVRTSTNKAPEGRYQSCHALLQALPGSTNTPSSMPSKKAGKPSLMVYVEGSHFSMGDSLGNGFMDERPSHRVFVSPFYVDNCPVTWAKYLSVVGGDPSTIKGEGNTPVDSVTWYDAIQYCNTRSFQEGLTPCYSYSNKGTNIDDWPADWNTKADDHTRISCDWSANGYRLPTEAEWEFAARGGKTGKNYTYSGGEDIDLLAWYKANSDGVTHSVATKEPNELGLFDMCGNVWEWCWDIMGKYQSISQINPTGPSEGDFRVLRGGSWDYKAGQCSVTSRLINDANGCGSNAGFRCVRSSV